MLKKILTFIQYKTSWLMILGLVALFLMWWRGYLNELVPETMRVVEPAGSVHTDGADGGSLLAPGSAVNDGDALPDDGSPIELSIGPDSPARSR